MCICCCITRKSLLIYALVVSSIAFIYGIITISQFGSNSDVYKALKEKIDYYDENKESHTYIRRLEGSYYDSYDYDQNDYRALLKISSLTAYDFENNPYNVIKSLKGIENGLGVILFVFSIIFLAAEITYLIFIRGTLEIQVLTSKLFYILYILKTITYALSIIFIFLSLLYSILLFIALMQYLSLINISDSCSYGIAVGIVFGYYSFWFYITLACIFGRERTLFIEVGSQDKPGARALYDVNGNMITRAVITQQVVGVPQIMIQPMGVTYQQVPAINPMQPNVPMYQQSQVQMPVQQQQNQNINSERPLANEKPNVNIQ